MKYILKFKEFLLEQAIQSEHYGNRKYIRLESTYTIPPFNKHLFENQIKILENIIYPNRCNFIIRMKVDKFYTNNYRGGMFPNDPQDKTKKNSEGKYLYFVVTDNSNITVYFGNYKEGENIVRFELIKELYDEINDDFSKVHFDNDSIKNKLKSLKYKDCIIIDGLNGKKYYNNKNINSDILIDTKTECEIKISSIKNFDEYEKIFNQIMKL
jgi:hypothetical protein